MPDSSILIVGAGVSGLALAQGLSHRRIPFALYERDASLTARAQGYRFRISDEGVQALQQNLGVQQFERLRQSCSPLTSCSNVPSAVLDAITGESAPSIFEPGERVLLSTTNMLLSADRTVLRKILMEGLEEHVHFGKTFESYRELDDGVIVRFIDGSEVQGLALIGADGAWSRVRHQLHPEYHLLDTEERLILGKTDMTKDFLERFSAQASTDLIVIRHPVGPSCLLEPMRFTKDAAHAPSDYVYWVLFMRPDDIPISTNGPSLSSEETAALAQRLTSDWHPSLRCLFQNANPGQSSLYRVLSARPPISLEVAARTRVTLLGDAIHPMAPTAALGATTALRDTGVLTQLIEQHGLTDVVHILRTYESVMRDYASEAIRQTVVGGKVMFGMRPFDELPVMR